jgi:hypothetical protein
LIWYLTKQFSGEGIVFSINGVWQLDGYIFKTSPDLYTLHLYRIELKINDRLNYKIFIRKQKINSCDSESGKKSSEIQHKTFP